MSCKVTERIQIYFRFVSEHKKWHKCIYVSFLALLIAELIWMTMSRTRAIFNPLETNMYLLPTNKYLLEVINGIADVLLIITNIFGCISIFTPTDLFTILLKLNDSGICSLVRNHFLACHIPWQLACIIQLILAYENERWWLWTVVFFRNFNRLFSQLLLLLLLIFTKLLNNEFQLINQKLSRSRCDLHTIRTLANSFHYLCNHLDRLNSKFKTFLAMSMIHWTSNIIKSWSGMLELCLTHDKSLSIDGKWLPAAMLMLNIMNSFNIAAQTGLISEKLRSEAGKTTTICLRLLREMPPRFRGIFHEEIRERIELLMHESRSRRVQLHAGGLFGLDWRIVGVIASHAANYSMVITQFLLNK